MSILNGNHGRVGSPFKVLLNSDFPKHSRTKSRISDWNQHNRADHRSSTRFTFPLLLLLGTIIISLVVQTPSTIQQDQSWQNRFNTRLTGSQVTFQNNQNFPSKQSLRPSWIAFHYSSSCIPYSRLDSQTFSNDQPALTDDFAESKIDHSKKPLMMGKSKSSEVIITIVDLFE